MAHGSNSATTGQSFSDLYSFSDSYRQSQRYQPQQKHLQSSFSGLDPQIRQVGLQILFFQVRFPTEKKTLSIKLQEYCIHG